MCIHLCVCVCIHCVLSRNTVEIDRGGEIQSSYFKPVGEGKLERSSGSEDPRQSLIQGFRSCPGALLTPARFSLCYSQEGFLPVVESVCDNSPVTLVGRDLLFSCPARVLYLMLLGLTSAA